MLMEAEILLRKVTRQFKKVLKGTNKRAARLDGEVGVIYEGVIVM